jgi:hypothetical protein
MPENPTIRESEPQEKSPEQLVREAREEFSRPVPMDVQEVIGQGNFLVKFPEESFADGNISWEGDVHISQDSLGVLMNKRDVIDCGCSDCGGTYKIASIAKEAGGNRYIGIDLECIPINCMTNENEGKLLIEAKKQQEDGYKKWEQENGKGIDVDDDGKKRETLKNMRAPGFIMPGEFNGFPMVLVRDDMLAALAKIEKTGNKFFIFAGITGGFDEFYEKLSVEVFRLCDSGDAVLTIGADERLNKALEKIGFERNKKGSSYATGFFWVKK